MDAVLEKILDIDQQAGTLVRKAEEKTADSEAIIAAEKEKLREQISRENTRKAESVRQNLITGADREAKKHEAQSAERIARMEAQAAAHTEEWVTELYGRILADRK